MVTILDNDDENRYRLGAMTRTILVCAAAWVTLLLAGCDGGGDSKTDGRLRVVAAENFYGNIVQQIGGAQVDVTSILSDPNADPHLFEPGSSAALAVAKARLVIQNGVGYDAFMSRLEHASPSTGRVVITVADVLGAHGSDANPHLWYDTPKLPRIAAAIATGLEQQDPAHAAAYRRGLVRFDASLAPLQDEVAAVRSSFAGRPVAYTEPVPGYLVAAAGLRNLAPKGFTRAIEDGTEPSPAAVSAMTALATGHRIRVLLYNTQAVSPITTRIRSAASAAGIAIVGVSETMPAGDTFQSWQLGQARALDRALHG
jgi:zinc/manganese transport system substrate-binding protein